MQTNYEHEHIWGPRKMTTQTVNQFLLANPSPSSGQSIGDDAGDDTYCGNLLLKCALHLSTWP
jgi:hypothetical protein